MAVLIRAETLPGKKTILTHEPSGATFKTSAPVDNAGDGSSFSPTDLVAAALASCIVTTMEIVAERDGITLGKMQIEVEKHMQQTPRRIGELRVRLRASKLATSELQRKFEAVAHSCPVHKSLHPEVAVPIEIIWE